MDKFLRTGPYGQVWGVVTLSLNLSLNPQPLQPHLILEFNRYQPVLLKGYSALMPGWSGL